MRFRPLGLIAVSALGCSSYRVANPVPPPINALGAPPTGLGQLCVVRPSWGAAAVTLVVRDNGRLVGATHGPSYFCYFAEPGSHKILSEVSDPGTVQTPVATAVAVDPGGRYFLQQTVMPGSLVFEAVGEGDAAKMIENCGYQILVRVPKPDHVPGMTPVAGAERMAR